MYLERLLSSMYNAPIVKKGNYNYYVFPITDGVPSLEPRVLEEVAEAIIEVADVTVDRIVTMEAMGIPIATALSLKTGIPFTIVRKRSYGLRGEVSVAQVTGYSKTTMYINGLSAGMRVLVVDDIISTGGTLIAVLKALSNMDIEIADVVMVVDKGEGKEKVRRELGVEVKTLVHVDEVDGKLYLQPSRSS